MVSVERFDSAGRQSSDEPSRRTVLRFGLILAGSVLLTACGSEPQDSEGLDKEKATAIAKVGPTPVWTPPLTFTDKMKSLLVPGKSVDIWQGTFIFSANLNRRRDAVEPYQAYCNDGNGPEPLIDVQYNCPIDGEGTDFWRRDEIVTNPLRLQGKAISYFLDNKTTPQDGDVVSPRGNLYGRIEERVDGFAYYTPIHKTFMWIALTDDAKRLVRYQEGREKVLYSNLEPITIRDIRQQVTIEQASIKPGIAPIVSAKKQTGEVIPLLNADTSKVLNRF